MSLHNSILGRLIDISSATSSFAWWNARRSHYNIGLLVAGVLAFIAYVVIGYTLLPYDAAAESGFEITFFTVLIQGIIYLIMIGIANLCYFLGPLSEKVVRPSNPERYRRNCYRLGFWFSVLLPFSHPVLFTFYALACQC